MSEPNAGSDLASLATSAVLDGDEWVINGQKIWTSFGAHADYCYLICRTSSDGLPHAGISEIIVPMGTPGVEVRQITDMTTNRHFCEVFYSDARVPKDNLVGSLGGAFKQTMRQLEHERGGIDRLVSNYALFLYALSIADTSNPKIRQEIAALESTYRIGRILVLREVLKQAPAGFRLRQSVFAPNMSSVSQTLSLASWGQMQCCGMISHPACYTHPATQSWAAHQTLCATSSASVS